MTFFCQSRTVISMLTSVPKLLRILLLAFEMGQINCYFCIANTGIWPVFSGSKIRCKPVPARTYPNWSIFATYLATILPLLISHYIDRAVSASDTKLLYVLTNTMFSSIENAIFISITINAIQYTKNSQRHKFWPHPIPGNLNLCYFHWEREGDEWDT